MSGSPFSDSAVSYLFALHSPCQQGAGQHLQIGVKLLVLEWRRIPGEEMEQKNVILSALSVGVGVGVGLGLASGQTVSRLMSGNSSSDEITSQQIEQELLKQIVDGKETNVKPDEFPYYLW